MEFSKERVLESWIILNKTGTSEQRKILFIYRISSKNKYIIIYNNRNIKMQLKYVLIYLFQEMMTKKSILLKISKYLKY